ncbi:MAG: hypothetical protein EOP53_21075 [Sphingobacteriales bacterium]|nr:MAG: hypothetical protein EOP53_21075 [Sphingobacteriales bacterium]
MFQGISASEFRRRFETDHDCRHFLHQSKWGTGYKCRRCGHGQFWKGRTALHARCKNCDYDESVTAYTIFHKSHMRLVKAFAITYQLTRVEEVSALQLAGLFRINFQSALLMKKKVIGVYELASGRKICGPKIRPLKIVV